MERRNERQSLSHTPINPGLQFNNAIIKGGEFQSIHGNYYDFQTVHHVQYYESGLFALSQCIASGATHDSAERYPPGKCHAGTREQIINIILDWINDPDPSSDVLWLYGPAGAGKSAIMQSIAELLLETPYDSEGRYAGSFFFGRDVDGRCDGKSLFSTLAYQIATRLPGMRELVNGAMNSDHTLPHKSMDIQFQSLIIEPLARSSSILHTPTIIIDGLDECRDSRTQREILSLITNARTKSLVPLRFLIASRSEYSIRECFDSKPLFDITKRISLSESRDADKDIKKYLQDGFAKIYTENLNIMGEVEQPWPSEKLIDYFVHNASGQFIYASTVLKFVDPSSDFHNPQEQLDIISTPGPLQASAFSDLDDLYTRILSVYPRREELLSVLGSLLAGAKLTTISVFLGVGSVGLKMTLRALESLAIFNHPEQTAADLDKLYGQDEIEFDRFHHFSFPEFLKDSTRSGPFAIDTQALMDRLCDGAFDSLINSLRGITTHVTVPISHYASAWYNFRISIVGKASPWKMCSHISNLLACVLKFRYDNCHLQKVQLKYLLRHLQYAEDLIRDPETFGHEDFFHQSLIDDLLADIQAVQNSTICEIITMDGLPMMAYFLSGHYFSSAQLCYLSGASNDTITSFFLCNAHFFEGFTLQAERYYYPLACVLNFLSSLSCGHHFYIEFRSQCIQACRSLLLHFCCPSLASSDLGLAKQNQLNFRIILRGFFSENSLSNILLLQDPQDIQLMENIINIMYHCDWKQIPVCPLEDPSNTAINSILDWLHLHLNDVSFRSENPNSSKMVEIISHICNTMVLPNLIEPYFSELFMCKCNWNGTLLYLSGSSLSLPNGMEIGGEVEMTILDKGDSIRTPGDGFVYGLLYDNFAPVPTISRILKESRYELGIKLSDWFTAVSEFYLHILAKNHYHQVDPDYVNYIGFPAKPDFELWLPHTIPTNKILTALRAIRYLGLKQRRRWRAPPGFCSFAIGLLQKSVLDEGGLKIWFEDLRMNELKVEDLSDEYKFEEGFFRFD